MKVDLVLGGHIIEVDVLFAKDNIVIYPHEKRIFLVSPGVGESDDVYIMEKDKETNRWFSVDGVITFDELNTLHEMIKEYQ